MKIGAYQFNATGSIEGNYSHIKKGIDEAERAGVMLFVFPECAVVGYPPRCIHSSADVDFEALDHIHGRLQKLAEKTQMHIVVGTIAREESHYFNRAMVFMADGKTETYSKRGIRKTSPKTGSRA